MDGPLLHSIWTVLLLAVFVGVVLYVYVYRSKEHFDEAAQLPFDDDPIDPHDKHGHEPHDPTSRET